MQQSFVYLQCIHAHIKYRLSAKITDLVIEMKVNCNVLQLIGLEDMYQIGAI